MRSHAGFSLIELMVAITVMTFITGVVVTQFAGFDSAIVTKARAYDAAQAVRAAQAFATQIRTQTSSDITFTTQFLTRFTVGSGEILIMRKEDTSQPNTVEYRQLTAGYKVQEIRVALADTTTRCAQTKDQQLDIAFRRPEVRANAYDPKSGTSWITSSSPVVRSYIAITGADPSLVHWVEIAEPGSVSIVQDAPACGL
ncbi:hypothetical protein A3C87_04055 [Candidatus Kaiserbacteria bacterium RIFCSPHIGHO2_02_FULL_49_34]|uniref:Prepilin-type N-terminal cleavage/methylation domain-containing protein n=1 Tax=Candidatus Kaiserbacteria bacterium RIFCSPHIGHO2_02_FULL_49_34 TaxID=1798491 RepID=A0A1F6DIX2_9BACT|nr:MAG: hypothetical protein A3C87_04055 [Candidatus Kaiserbacteria bacterium RIFCSPHIGHO2_02_FULL_49_34]